MIVEILFILHVANGFYLIIHNVIWYNYLYKYCFPKILSLNSIFQDFSMIYYMLSLSKKFSLTFTMFEVSDGNSLRQRFSKCFQ